MQELIVIVQMLKMSLFVIPLSAAMFNLNLKSEAIVLVVISVNIKIHICSLSASNAAISGTSNTQENAIVSLANKRLTSLESIVKRPGLQITVL